MELHNMLPSHIGHLVNPNSPKWNTELMERSVFAISSFTAAQHNALIFLAVEIDKAQEKSNQGLADVHADKFFEMFGGWIR